METPEKQVGVWLGMCRRNLRNFQVEHPEMSPGDKLQFIQEQRRLLKSLEDVLNRKAFVTGVDPSKFDHSAQR